MNGKKGLTLIELVIALGLLGFVMGILFYFINWKVRESIRERNIAFLNADVAMARQLIEWDVWMAGYGLRSDISPISIHGGGYNSSDTLILRAVAFITRSGKWTYTLRDENNSSELFVKRWSHSSDNFSQGDTVVIMLSNKRFVMGPVSIVDVRDTTFPAGVFIRLPDAVQKLPLGSLIFEASGLGGNTYSEVKYVLGSDEILRRAGEELMRNVVEFWVDIAMDTTSDLNGEITWFDSLDSGWSPDYIRTRLKAVQVAIVSHSARKDKDYLYPSNTIKVTTPDSSVVHTYNLSDDDFFYRWNTTIIVANPKNLLR